MIHYFEKDPFLCFPEVAHEGMGTIAACYHLSFQSPPTLTLSGGGVWFNSSPPLAEFRDGDNPNRQVEMNLYL